MRKRLHLCVVGVGYNNTICDRTAKSGVGMDTKETLPNRPAVHSPSRVELQSQL